MEIGHGQGGSAGTETSMAGSPAFEDGGEPSGGTTSTAGSSGSTQGGSGGTTPYVGGPLPKLGAQREAGKVDLLLAIDNSLSMSEKQKLLAQSLPELVERLVNPPCLDGAGNVVSTPATPGAACPGSSARETKPLRDLHIGVITSSLGSHGSTEICTRPEDNDRAELLPFVREGLPSYQGRGYLKWDPDGLAAPPGETDVQALVDAVKLTVEAAGEDGCGFEAQLESVYRFLIDPEPPLTIERDPSTSLSVPTGINRAVLQQRADFLRPDSSVVVLMLTDENDCSIVDEGYGWLLARVPNGNRVPPMFRSTSQCLTNPNDECCQSCGEGAAREGCPALESDAECSKSRTLEEADDSVNLRCFDNKRRFGFDLLYPTARYVNAFGGGTILTRSGELVENPLFSRDGTKRDPSLFTFAVVGGVPWQDLATTASLGGDTLQLLTATQLETQSRWPLLIGNVSMNVPPQDPFMRESVEPRLGKNVLTGEDIVPATSQDPAANSINGHDHDTMGIELQYACTFDLPEPIECNAEDQAAGRACECYDLDLSANRSVCNPPGGGAPTNTQYKDKAYPSLRELRVARELGRRTVLGSVCSRNTSDDTRSDYGYRPVLDALGQRIASTLAKP